MFSTTASLTSSALVSLLRACVRYNHPIRVRMRREGIEPLPWQALRNVNDTPANPAACETAPFQSPVTQPLPSVPSAPSDPFQEPLSPTQEAEWEKYVAEDLTLDPSELLAGDGWDVAVDGVVFI